MQALGPNQELWLKDLETTEVPQEKEYLSVEDKNGNLIGDCCLGRACKVFGLFPNKKEEHIDPLKIIVFFNNCSQQCPLVIVEKLKFYSCTGSSNDSIGDHCLVILNDTGKTFKEIAAIIRKDPSVYFSEPA